MNKRYVLLLPVIFLAIPNTAHADVASDVTCTTVTFTAPEGTRVIFGLDDQPPGEVANGATTTVEFYGDGMHEYGYIVLGPDSNVPLESDFGVVGCAEPEIAAGAGEATSIARHEESAPAALDLSPWQHVELAPPW